VVKPAYSWIILIACFWLLIALGVTILRFGELPGGSEQIAAAVLGFLLVGLLSGFILISLLRRMDGNSGSVFVVVGYILAIPFGYGFGIVGPLALEAFGVAQLSAGIDYFLLFPLAISLYGSLPPVLGAVIGLLIGRISKHRT
jgi:hypothetical protein